MGRPTAALLLTLIALGSTSCGAFAPRGGIQAVPGSQVPFHSRLRNVDLLIDAEGTFHVVCDCWARTSSDRSMPGDQEGCLYLRGRNHGTSWDLHRLFSAHRAVYPRIVETGGELCILYSDQVLMRVTSDDQGRTWSQPRPVLSNESRRPLNFDVEPVGDTLAVTFVVTGGGNDSLDLCYAMLGRAAQGPRRVLATEPDEAHSDGAKLQPTSPCAPRLHVDGSSLIAVFPLNWLQEPARLGTSEDSWIESFRSTDAGEHWSREASIVAGQPWHDSRSPLPMAHAEIAGTRPLSLIIDAIPIMRAQRTAGGWSTPENALERSGVSVEPSRTVVATNFQGKPWIAWIDYRHRARDWSLLGVFDPRWLFTDPEWINNDVYAGIVPTSDGRGLAWSPRRLTPALSFATSLAMATDGDRLVVMWSGRKRVGKEQESPGSSRPEILWTTVSSR